MFEITRNTIKMITTLTITVGALGFALGLYVSSQIMAHIIGKPTNKLLKNLEEYNKRKQL